MWFVQTISTMQYNEYKYAKLKLALTSSNRPWLFHII